MPPTARQTVERYTNRYMPSTTSFVAILMALASLPAQNLGDHYVDGVRGRDLPTGGTPAAPWKTITYALAQIPPVLDPTRWRTLFASGVNSPQLDMPPGIALRVPAGAQLVLGLHLFNTSGSVLTGQAALDILTATDSTGLKEAGVPFAGNPSFTIPVSPPHEVQGVCTVDRATKFFAVFPHMHQTGAHMKVWVTGSVGTRTVWDEDYDFNDQRFGQFAPIELAAGDKIHMTCTYSPAGAGKTFGDSSLSEMCFAISYVSPPIASAGSLCSN